MSSKPHNLPAPRAKSDISLEAAITSRRSVRLFQDKPLEERTIGQILWASQGLRGEGNFRTVPSAGALYPLELFTITECAIQRYLPETHALLKLREGEYRPHLARAALDQEFIQQASLSLLFAAVPQRTIVRYGVERSSRYIDIEIGHAAQNAMLQASALSLGSVAIGAFHDDDVAALFKLPQDTVPRYLVSIGTPA